MHKCSSHPGGKRVQVVLNASPAMALIDWWVNRRRLCRVLGTDALMNRTGCTSGGGGGGGHISCV